MTGVARTTPSKMGTSRKLSPVVCKHLLGVPEEKTSGNPSGVSNSVLYRVCSKFASNLLRAGFSGTNKSFLDSLEYSVRFSAGSGDALVAGERTPGLQEGLFGTSEPPGLNSSS